MLRSLPTCEYKAIMTVLPTLARTAPMYATWDADDLAMAGVLGVLSARKNHDATTPGGENAYTQFALKLARNEMLRIVQTGSPTSTPGNRATRKTTPTPIYLDENDRTLVAKNPERDQDADERNALLVEHIGDILPPVQKQGVAEYYGLFGSPKLRAENTRRRRVYRAILYAKKYFTSYRKPRPRGTCNRHELAGTTVGSLYVIKREGTTKSGYATWLCRCACGKTLVKASKHILAHSTCGFMCPLHPRRRKEVQHSTE